MRGLMFNYLLEYIESAYGYNTVDTIIGTSSVENDGSYADGGMYEDEELMNLIATASEILHEPVPQLLVSYGKYTFTPLYKKFMTIYDKDSYNIESINNVFDFIDKLEDIHYKEVVKLYPDSIFPHFNIIARNDSMIKVLYRSQRHLPFLANGLIEGCIEYFDEALTIEMQDGSKEKDTHFIIRKDQR